MQQKRKFAPLFFKRTFYLGTSIIILILQMQPAPTAGEFRFLEVNPSFNSITADWPLSFDPFVGPKSLADQTARGKFFLLDIDCAVGRDGFIMCRMNISAQRWRPPIKRVTSGPLNVSQDALSLYFTAIYCL